MKVAIIDGGFAGYRQRQAEGDLPSNLITADYCGGKFEAGESHGTAVAEIVHEMAPSAQLYLVCIDTIASLGQAKDYAKAQGVQIIDSSGAFVAYGRGDGSGGPSTPDGIIADARQSGILSVNAAGNSGGFSLDRNVYRHQR